MILKSFKKMWRNRRNGKIYSKYDCEGCGKAIIHSKDVVLEKQLAEEKRKLIWKKLTIKLFSKLKKLQEKLANHHIENEKRQILQEDVKKLEVQDWEEYDKAIIHSKELPETNTEILNHSLEKQLAKAREEKRGLEKTYRYAVHEIKKLKEKFSNLSHRKWRRIGANY